MCTSKGVATYLHGWHASQQPRHTFFHQSKVHYGTRSQQIRMIYFFPQTLVCDYAVGISYFQPIYTLGDAGSKCQQGSMDRFCAWWQPLSISWHKKLWNKVNRAQIGYLICAKLWYAALQKNTQLPSQELLLTSLLPWHPPVMQMAKKEILCINAN